jgi:hypothetical protein
MKRSKRLDGLGMISAGLLDSKRHWNLSSWPADG